MLHSHFIYYPSSSYLISIEGSDSSDFLHRLSTAHVKSMAFDEGSEGCFLTPQGKIQSYFWLWRYGISEYTFEFFGSQNALSSNQIGMTWKNNLLAFIDQYTFAEKLKLTDLSEALKCVWVFTDESFSNQEWPTTGKTLAHVESIRICCHGTITLRDKSKKIWWSAWANEESLQKWLKKEMPHAQSLTLDEFESWRIQSLQASLGQEIKESTSPLEVGLKNAIASNKGCYPGQEVIEKVISLGSPAKRLAYIEFENSPTLPFSDLQNFQNAILHNLGSPPQEIGEVTSLAFKEGQLIGLGLIKKIHAKENLEVFFYWNENRITGKLIELAAYE